MKDKSALAYKNLNKYAYLLCNLASGKHMKLSRGETVRVHPTDNVFLYVIKGSLETVSGSGESLRQNMLLFITPCRDLTLQSTADCTDCLLLHFDIYTHVGQEYDDVKGRLNSADSNYTELVNHKTNLYLDSVIDVSGDSTICLNFKRIQKELDIASPIKELIIQNLISDIVVQLFQKFKSIDVESFFHAVDGVCLTSISPNDTVLPAGREIFITDVDLWSDNRHNQESILLGTFYTQQYYVDIPKSPDQLTYTHLENCLYEKKGVGHVVARENTPYHVWFWQQKGVEALDLRTHADTCYITFYIKSNRTGPIGFSVFNTSIYKEIHFRVEITVPDCWMPVKLFLCSHSELSFSPYVNTVLSYIQTHYNQKISTKDIAAHINLHPSYISSVFRQQTGRSIRQYITDYRLTIAKDLLLQTGATIESIALDSGFYDIQHFSRVFEKKVGMRPSVYRKVNKAGDSREES